MINGGVGGSRGDEDEEQFIKLRACHPRTAKGGMAWNVLVLCSGYNRLRQTITDKESPVKHLFPRIGEHFLRGKLQVLPQANKGSAHETGKSLVKLA